MSVGLNTKGRFEVLDGLRGLAAIMVMLLHYTQNLHLPFTFNAYLAVDIFFALSGFVISHAYAEKLASGMSGMEFMARRLGRLFPLCAVGVALGFIALVSGQSHTSNMAGQDDLTASLLNLFLLPYFDAHLILQPSNITEGMLFPGNTPLWSIFFELVASFAFIELVKFSNSHLLKIVLAAFAALVFVPLLIGTATMNHPFNIDAGWNTSNAIMGLPRVLFGFISGMLLYRGVTNASFQRKLGSIAFLKNGLGPCALLILTLAFPWTFKGAYGLLVVAFAAPLIVAWGALSHIAFGPLRKILHFLGWLSFPIYCLHEPFLTLCQTWAEQTSNHRLLGIPAALVAAPMAIAFAIAAGWVFDRLRVQQRFTAALIAQLPATAPPKAMRPS
jgi:peptidoglycan/LPS O-acetylase OafA/YrhL